MIPACLNHVWWLVIGLMDLVIKLLSYLIGLIKQELEYVNQEQLLKTPHSLFECRRVSRVCLVSLWMPVRRHTYQRGALYLPKEDQCGSHRHARSLIFYWLAPQRLIFYWLAPLSSLSLLAGSSWGQPVSCAELRWRGLCQDDLARHR